MEEINDVLKSLNIKPSKINIDNSNFDLDIDIDIYINKDLIEE